MTSVGSHSISGREKERESVEILLIYEYISRSNTTVASLIYVDKKQVNVEELFINIFQSNMTVSFLIYVDK